MSRMSIATIKSPEFVNITSISPLVSKCEIKVLYVGQNRNRSFISKEVATEMAQTLPGVPIVGYYSENKEDFRDHGEQMIFDGDGIKFNCLTKPYGFVAPDAKIWFKEFQDTDDFGNQVTREYLMCEGYLWTEQYQEAKKIINEGRPQSMELDDDTLKGFWSTDNNRGIDFFIINDAIITKLCALGTDVEPCFEGASVTKPDVSVSFTKDEKVFTKTIYSMMQELKNITFALKEEGGKTMPNPEIVQNESTNIVDNNETAENFSANQDNSSLESNLENQVITEEFKKNSDEEEKDDKSKEENKNEKSSDDDKKKEEDEEPEKKHALVEQELKELNDKFTQLQTEYEALKAENEVLIKFREGIENAQKDDLINSFTNLSEEDKKDVIENKSKYSLEEIKSKLAVICFDKKINFTKEENKANTNIENVQEPVTFNINTIQTELPEWLAAVESRRNKK